MMIEETSSCVELEIRGKASNAEMEMVNEIQRREMVGNYCSAIDVA